jgi:hypothetical protein
MEILDLKFGGVPISVWLGVVGIIWLCKKLFEGIGEWRERRQWGKEYDAKKRAWEAEHVWQVKMVGGADCGEWVRRDGRPIRDDEWDPATALLERLAEKGPGNG